MMKTSYLIFFILCFSLSSFSQNARDYFQKGSESELLGHDFQAIEFYRASLAQNSRYFDPLFGLARVYFRLGEYENAELYILQAHRLNMTSSRVINLMARINIGLGNFEIARELFQSVLRKEPYNLEAKFGLAEVDVVYGNFSSAIDEFIAGLQVFPDNKRALLALIILYNNLEKFDEANVFVRQLLYYHSGDFDVHSAVAKHFHLHGNYIYAELHALQALSMSPEDFDMLYLLAKIYLESDEIDSAVNMLEKILAKNRSNPDVWYLMGLAQYFSGNFTAAVSNWTKVLELRSDDEVSRIALENLLIQHYAMDSSLRQRYADYHFRLGAQYVQKNNFTMALYEYRRGLIIDPWNDNKRLEFAQIFRRRNNLTRYLDILKLVYRNGNQSTKITDEIEIYESLLQNSLANAWNIDPFLVSKDLYKISAAFDKQKSSSHHFGLEEVLLPYIQSTLMTDSLLNMSTASTRESFSELFTRARNNNSDYFMHLSAYEDERFFRVSAKLYDARTGVNLSEFQVYRTGNFKIISAIQELSRYLNNLLPYRARIIDRQFDTALINWGSESGLETGDELLIIKNHSLNTRKDKIAFQYDDTSVVGRLILTDVNEYLSAGQIERTEFFDFVNIGDHIILPNHETAQVETVSGQEPSMTEASRIYKELLQIP